MKRHSSLADGMALLKSSWFDSYTLPGKNAVSASYGSMALILASQPPIPYRSKYPRMRCQPKTTQFDFQYRNPVCIRVLWTRRCVCEWPDPTVRLQGTLTIKLLASCISTPSGVWTLTPYKGALGISIPNGVWSLTPFKGALDSKDC